MVVAVALLPIWRKDIRNHHGDVGRSISHVPQPNERHLNNFVGFAMYGFCNNFHVDGSHGKGPMDDKLSSHYNDVMIGAMASQITRLTIVYSAVYSGADQRKHQSSSSLAFVWGIHRWPVNSPHKWPVTRKMFPFDDVIMSVNGLPPNTRRTFIWANGPVHWRI